MFEIYKFGGTCTDTKHKLKRIVELIKAADTPLVVTLSAVAGVTDRIKLILQTRLTEDIIKSFIEEIKTTHTELLPENTQPPKAIKGNLTRLERLLFGIQYTEELTDRTHDLVMSFGERLIAIILRFYILGEGLKAEIKEPEQFILTDGQFNNSRILLEETEELIQTNLRPDLDQYDVIIVPGFYGSSEEGIITLLGRSGTDYTATALAYGLNAKSITIWKDVHGFMSADPRIVPTAHTISQLSYAEAAELAYFGATLLHPRAASPARLKKIPILIRHINELDSTIHINGHTETRSKVIKSVSHMSNLAVVKVYASVGGNTKGVLASIAQKISEAEGNSISIATSQTCIAFLMNEWEAERVIDAIKSLGPSIVDSVELQQDISLICIVGEGLGKTPGIASKVFEAVAREKINVELISAGASEVAYHFTVRGTDLNKALRAIHTFFFEGD